MVKWLVRRWLAPLLLYGGGFAALRFLRRQVAREPRLLILLYHRVHDPSTPTFRYQSDTLAVSPGNFERQIAYLGRNYSVLPLGDALQRLRAGTLPRGGAVAITFDDGYRDNATTALPVLRSNGVSATVFLATDFIGTGRLTWFDRLAVLLADADQAAFRQRLGAPPPAGIDRMMRAYLDAPAERRKVLINLLCEELKQQSHADRQRILDALSPEAQVAAAPSDRLMLDWSEVRQMAEAGTEFGSHSCSHPLLSQLPRPEAERELAESRHAIEEAVGRSCWILAYPNGRPEDWPEDAPALLRSTGYSHACTTVPGVNVPATEAAYLRRVSIGNHPLPLFALTVEYWLTRSWLS